MKMSSSISTDNPSCEIKLWLSVFVLMCMSCISFPLKWAWAKFLYRINKFQILCITNQWHFYTKAFIFNHFHYIILSLNCLVIYSMKIVRCLNYLFILMIIEPVDRNSFKITANNDATMFPIQTESMCFPSVQIHWSIRMLIHINKFRSSQNSMYINGLNCDRIA